VSPPAIDGNKIVVEHDEPGVAVVTLSGEIEEFVATKLQSRLESLLGGGAGIVIDLSRAIFIDAGALLVLLRTRKTAEERGLGFVLWMDDSTGPYVVRAFELTRLMMVFAIARSRSEAVEAARAGGAAPDFWAEPA
jgi:anti-anti-sigma factor